MALGDESCDLRQQLLRWSRLHVGSASETYYLGMVTPIFFFLFVTPISYSLWQQCYNPNFLFIYINVYFIVLCFLSKFYCFMLYRKIAHIYIGYRFVYVYILYIFVYFGFTFSFVLVCSCLFPAKFSSMSRFMHTL